MLGIPILTRNSSLTGLWYVPDAARTWRYVLERVYRPRLGRGGVISSQTSDKRGGQFKKLRTTKVRRQNKEDVDVPKQIQHLYKPTQTIP